MLSSGAFQNTVLGLLLLLSTLGAAQPRTTGTGLRGQYYADLAPGKAGADPDRPGH